MDSPASKATSPVQDVVARIGSNEITPFKNEKGNYKLHPVEQNEEEGLKEEVGNNEPEVEKQQELSPPTDDKTTLQDQTNILPMKQLILVFVGLSCALFCSLLDQTM